MYKAYKKCIIAIITWLPCTEKLKILPNSKIDCSYLLTRRGMSVGPVLKRSARVTYNKYSSRYSIPI